MIGAIEGSFDEQIEQERPNRNKTEVVQSYSAYRASCGDAAHPGAKVGTEIVEGRGVGHVVDCLRQKTSRRG